MKSNLKKDCMYYTQSILQSFTQSKKKNCGFWWYVKQLRNINVTKNFTTFIITNHMMSCEWWRRELHELTNFYPPLTTRYLASCKKICNYSIF